MQRQECDIGIVGLGVMGRNLLLNVADHGFAAVGYDLDAEKLGALSAEGKGRSVFGAKSSAELLSLLRKPRAIMALVPAGKPVDAVIHDLAPHLEPGDVLVDGGNSHFTDTERRAKEVAAQGLHFLGVGISGGERGARLGPSIMPGGTPEAYSRVRPIFEAVAAHVHGEPCVAYLGPGSAGHYVKMVHNGIEYGLMRLISETYHLMKQGLGLDNNQLADVYDRWNDSELEGYLIEITVRIFRKQDDISGKRLVDVVLDEALQKGTGIWTSEDAMVLHVPVMAVDAEVAMREMSAIKGERQAASRILTVPERTFQGDRQAVIEQLRRALYGAMIVSYAQGMAQLRRASQTYNYGLKLENVARIWRGGCIIRAALLEDIRAAYQAQPDLPNLLVDPRLAKAVLAVQSDLRSVVQTFADLAIPAPGFMVSLAYFDSYRSAWLPANLTEAQRDCFGAHGYQRIDRPGTFHTEWEQ